MPVQTSNYPYGFPSGLITQGLPIAPMSRKVYYVGNYPTLLKGEISASDSNDGSYYKPWSTLQQAINSMAKGDIVYVRPAYGQQISGADGVTVNVDGISIIGLGHGGLRPTFIHTNAASTFSVNADNVYIANLNFIANVTSITVGLNIKANCDYVVIDGCRFTANVVGTDEFLHSIRLVDNNTGCRIENNIIDMGIAGATVGIHLDADTDKTTIRNNIVRGDYSTACIAGDTTLSTNLLIDSNLLVNGKGGDINTEPGIELLTGTEGIIQNNNIVCNLATKAASIVADTCLLFNNYYNEDVSSAATGGIIGTASADD